MILLSRKLFCCMGFSVKQDHFLCFSSAKCSVPHHVITNSGSRQQTAEVKVQASIDTVHSQVPLESAEIRSKLMVEPSRQLKFQEPSSSRNEGWNSFAQTQTSIISSGAVKDLSWHLGGTSERLMCSLERICHHLQMSQTAHPVWTCSWTTCFTWLFLSRVIELGISKDFCQPKWFCGFSWKQIPVHWAPESSALPESTDSDSSWLIWECLGEAYPMRCSSPLWARTALMENNFMPGQEGHPHHLRYTGY